MAIQEFKAAEVQGSSRGPGYLQVNYDPDSFGATVGTAMRGMGQAVEGVGSSIASLGPAIERIADKKREQDSYNTLVKAKDELRPWMYDPQDGLMAKQGGAALGGGAVLNTAISDIQKRHIDSIKDPQTREAVQRMWDRETETAKDSVARHELGQMQAYRADTRKAVLLDAMQDAYNNYTDPDSIQQALNKSKEIIQTSSGELPPEAIAVAEAEAESSIHLAVVSRWASTDPYKAFEYYEENKDKISGKDHITAGQLVDAARTTQRAKENVARITSSGAAANSIYEAIEFAESGGDPTAFSKAGALGLMQVMPGTAREVALRIGRGDVAQMTDEKMREFFSSEAGQSVNRQLGRTYFDEQLKRYHGDVEAALVAYNAGPGWADKWLAANAGKGPGTRSYDVTENSKLKSETFPYVQKILGRLGGPTAGSIPAGQRMTRQNWTLRNFAPDELMAPTGPGQWVDARSAMAIDEVAQSMKARFPGFKISVNERHDFTTTRGTAGRRRGTSDPKDNPHVENSQHLKGTAFDVQAQGWTTEQKAAFIMEARAQGFKGFGFYGPSGHLHVDMGSARTWGRIPAWAREALKAPIGSGPTVAAAAAMNAGGAPEGEIQLASIDVEGTPLPPDLPQSTGSFFNGLNNAYVNPNASDTNSWLAQAMEIPDPGEREQTLARIRLLIADQEKAAEAQKAQIQGAAWQIVGSGGSVRDIPPELLMQMGPEFYGTLSTFEERRTNGTIVHEDSAWYELNRMTPQDLSKVDLLTNYRNRLDQTHWDKAVTMQREALASLGGDSGAEERLAGTRTAAQIVADMAKQMGWNENKTDGAEKIGQMHRKLDEELIARQKDGKRLNATEIQDILDKMLLQDQSPWIRGGEYAMNIPPEEAHEFIAHEDWDSVQRDDQILLIERFNEMVGRDPQAEEALDVYNRAMQVYLGARPTGPEEEQQLLRNTLEPQLGYALTDSQFEFYYAKYLLRFLGR